MRRLRLCFSVWSRGQMQSLNNRNYDALELQDHSTQGAMTRCETGKATGSRLAGSDGGVDGVWRRDWRRDWHG